jgi:hypothetical protein
MVNDDPILKALDKRIDFLQNELKAARKKYVEPIQEQLDLLGDVRRRITIGSRSDDEAKDEEIKRLRAQLRLEKGAFGQSWES